MLLKKSKRAFALLLAGVLTLSSMGVPPLSAEAAGETNSATGTWEKEYRTELADMSFSGTNSYIVPEEDAEQFAANLSKAASLEVSMTFKYEDTGKACVSLLEISNKADNTDETTGDYTSHREDPAKKTMALMMNSSGRVYFHTGAFLGSTIWQGDSGQAINDGAYHTLTMSLSSGKLCFKIDGKSITQWTTSDSAKYTCQFVQGFFGTEVDDFEDWRAEADTISIGGFSGESYFWHSNYSNFKGEMKSVTIKTKTEEYSEASLNEAHRSGSAAAMAELNALLATVGDEADYNKTKWASYVNSAAYTTAAAMSAESNAPYEIYNACTSLETAIEKLKEEVDPNAQVFDLSSATFSGTGYSLPEADVEEFKRKVQDCSSVEFSITFSVSSASTNFINLLEIAGSTNNSESTESGNNKNAAAVDPQDSIALIVSKTGQVYFMSGAYQGSTDWNAASGVTVTGGGSHTLTLTIAPDGLSFTMDGGETKKVAADSTKYTKKFIQAFFGMDVQPVTINSTSVEYTDWRENIDTIVIGGLSDGSFHTASTFTNLNGTVSEVLLTCKGSAEDITLLSIGSDISNMFNTTDADNTWLFAGGVETQGRFEEIRGVRSFVGQFEEYIRWTKATSSELLRQRYMINVGKAGQDIVTFESKLDDYITSLQPKAVDYMIGVEDYSKGDEGIEAFKTALASVIEKALAMKNNGGYAVIQLPHAVKNAEAAANIEKYIAAAKSVIASVDASKLSHVVMVDHYTQTNNDTFKNSKLTENDLLNADGHYEIAKQLATKTEGMSKTFPTLSKWTEESAPVEYMNQAPAVTATANSLNVTVPEGVEGENWKYVVTVAGTEISGTATGSSFTINTLPAGKEYELVLQSADGKKQLNAVYGTIAAGKQGGNAALSELQQAIVEKVNGDSPLTWLFMGDSITHAALWTNGYDGIAQVMEKYIKEDLGRADDIVINTGNSSATTATTIANIEQRLTKYTPDIVALMIGTNDATSVNYATYKANLETIVGKIKEVNPNALIILRSPTPPNDTTRRNRIENQNYLQAMQAVAEANNGIFIDQYTDWTQEIDTYPYLYTGNYWFGNKTTTNPTESSKLHPGAAGQLRMAQQFITECGLNTNTEIANLSYQFSYTETKNASEPAVSVSQNAIRVSKSSLQTLISDTIGDYTVVLTDKNTNRTYTKSAGIGGEEVTITNLPTDRSYTVTVTANIAGSTAKHVTFAAKEVALSTGMAGEFEVVFNGSSNLEGLAAGTAAGTLSVDEMAPEGVYTYTLCDGEDATDNDKFEIAGTTLKVKTLLALRQTYSIRVKADNGKGSTAQKVITLTTLPTLKTVRAEAQADFAEDRTALDIDVSGVPFDGTTSVNLADSTSEYYNGGAYMEVLNKLRTDSTGGTIIFRFKTSDTGTILGIGSVPGDNGKNLAFALANGSGKTGTLRGLFPIASGGSNLKGYLGEGYANGQVHTVAMSFDTTKTDYQNEVLICVDGNANCYNTSWWTETYRTWLNMLTEEITKFEIGGGNYSNQVDSNVGGFNGSIDFVTITDEVFTEEELKRISSDREEIAAPERISEATVTVNENNTVTADGSAGYTASNITWNEDKTSGSFVLTANSGNVFSNLQLTVNNASGYFVSASALSGSSITVTMTKIIKEIVITNTSISDTAAGTVIGTLSVNRAEEGESFTYTLASGTADNDKFEIDGTTLKVKTALEKGMTYSVAVTATSNAASVTAILSLKTLPTLKSARDEAAAAFEADQTGMDVDVSDVNFDGSTSVNLAALDDGAYLAVAEKLRESSTGGTIILRFKTNTNGTLLGIGSEPGDNGKSLAFALADGSKKTGALRGIFPIASGESKLKGYFGEGYADGQVHTVAMSFDTTKADYQNEVLICVDGNANGYNTSWWTEAYRTWLNMLKTGITDFVIGGGSYSNQVDSAVGAFHGEIDFVTITDTVYNEAELKSISGDTTTVPRTTKVTSAQATLSADLASVTTGAATYTGTVSWDDAKENGTITLTADENVKFSGTTVSVTNAAALGYTAGTPNITEHTITIPLTKNEEPPQPQIITVSGVQTLTISDDTVTVAEDAGYTASALTWNEDGTSAEFSLTANENVVFSDDVTVTIANADEMSILKVAFTVTAGSVTVTLTKEKPAPSETTEQKNLKEEITNLAAELGKESAYTSASFKQFREAYEAAQKAITDGEADAQVLNTLLANLKQAYAGLVTQTTKPDPTIPTPTTPAPVEIKAGQTYDAGNYRYKVTSTTDMTAEVAGLKNTSITKVTINNTVSLGGKNYTVTSVGANAFKGNKKITSVVIKKNVKTIGKNAFANCTKLKKVTMNSTKLTTINAKAFYGCKSLKTITMKSKVLKKVGKNVFKGIHKKAVIKVPSAKLKAYTKLLAKKGQSKTVKIKK